MKSSTVIASQLDETAIRKLRVLLGRAYTDERHVRGFSPEERDRWAVHIERVHQAPPFPGELMPDAYLKRFPTVRNSRHAPGERRESVHLIVEASDGSFASHVSLWAQRFEFGASVLYGGYIENVATDPLHLGQSLAREGMRRAEAEARNMGLQILGLASGLQGYYEKLGWLPWDGEHTFHVAEHNAAYPDQPLYLLPLCAEALEVCTASGHMKSWRLASFAGPTAVQ